MVLDTMVMIPNSLCVSYRSNGSVRGQCPFKNCSVRQIRSTTVIGASLCVCPEVSGVGGALVDESGRGSFSDGAAGWLPKVPLLLNDHIDLTD